MQSIIRVVAAVIVTLLAACGQQYPEPSAEQPTLSAWVESQYGQGLREAEIYKINSASDKPESPVYVAMKDADHIYFGYPKDTAFIPFVIDMASGKPVVKHEGVTEDTGPAIQEAIGEVVEEAIRRGKEVNAARDKRRQAGG